MGALSFLFQTLVVLLAALVAALLLPIAYASGVLLFIFMALHF